MAELVDSYVKLLLPFSGNDGATADIDHSGFNHPLTFVGTAQLDTAQYVFPPSSLLLDGNSDYVTVQDSDDWIFDDKETIDFRIRINSFVGDTTILVPMGHATDGNNFWRFLIWRDGETDARKISFRWYEAGLGGYQVILTSSIALSLATWQHIAIVRDGSDWTLYIDGTSRATDTDDSAMSNFTGALTIGRNPYSAASYVNGHFAEIRISKGVARWTANFTPPPYPYHRIARIQNL